MYKSKQGVHKKGPPLLRSQKDLYNNRILIRFYKYRIYMTIRSYNKNELKNPELSQHLFQD